MSDRREHRLTIVPSLGYYVLEDSSTGRTKGAVDVRVDTTYGSVRGINGEPMIGEWKALDSWLSAIVGDNDYGPRSGHVLDYQPADVAAGKVSLGLCATRLVGSFVEGRSFLGSTDAKRDRRALAFSWSLHDVDEIRVCMTKKYMKLWCEEVFVSCHDPMARLRLGPVSHVRDRGKLLKPGLKSGHDSLTSALVTALTNVGASVTWRTDGHREGEDRVATVTHHQRVANPETQPTAKFGSTDLAPPVVPGGWYPDPHRRYELRRWDGAAWQRHVSTAGVVSEDVVG